MLNQSNVLFLIIFDVQQQENVWQLNTNMFNSCSLSVSAVLGTRLMRAVTENQTLKLRAENQNNKLKDAEGNCRVRAPLHTHVIWFIVNIKILITAALKQAYLALYVIQHAVSGFTVSRLHLTSSARLVVSAADKQSTLSTSGEGNIHTIPHRTENM